MEVKKAEMKKTIIVVDDERIVADTMSLFLNRTGEFDAYACYDHYDALEQGRKTKPDLVLLDVLRPAGHGLEDACEVGKQLHCPVILMSGAALHHREIECPGDSAGPFQLLLKPIPPAELLEQLKHFLETGKIKMTASQN